MHDFEAFSEAVAEGAWGARAARLAERLREGVDLEHWAAFQRSFHGLAKIVEEVATGQRGEPRRRSSSCRATCTTPTWRRSSCRSRRTRASSRPSARRFATRSKA